MSGVRLANGQTVDYATNETQRQACLERYEKTKPYVERLKEISASKDRQAWKNYMANLKATEGEEFAADVRAAFDRATK